MVHRIHYICWLISCLLGPLAGAAPCIRLAGVVRDYDSHQPLTAQLYLKTPTGRLALGNSTDAGQFRVEISCTATVLMIEKAGYRPQLLTLNMAALVENKAPIAVIIPLIPVDQRGNDRPYLQTEQTFFVQTAGVGKTTDRPLHNTFVVTDALTGAALPAQTLFVFTRSGQKRTLTADAAGRLSIDFPEKDIVAFEVASPGYQTYTGNFTIEQLDGRQLRHTIRLTRELTLLSVRLGVGTGSCELRPDGSMPVITSAAGSSATGKMLKLEPVPGLDNGVVACNLTARRYTLLTYDRQHSLLGQRAIVLRSGLNVVETVAAESTMPASVSAPTMGIPIPTEPLDRLDSLPMLYFEQGSYTLQAASAMTLLQVAAYLKQHPRVNVQLAGHADKEGDERLNRSLAEFRAKVVSTFLNERGITDDRMELVGYGSQFPVAPNDTEENKAKNRRVVMKFFANKTQ